MTGLDLLLAGLLLVLAVALSVVIGSVWVAAILIIGCASAIAVFQIPLRTNRCRTCGRFYKSTIYRSVATHSIKSDCSFCSDKCAPPARSELGSGDS